MGQKAFFSMTSHQCLTTFTKLHTPLFGTEHDTDLIHLILKKKNISLEV